MQQRVALRVGGRTTVAIAPLSVRHEHLELEADVPELCGNRDLAAECFHDLGGLRPDGSYGDKGIAGARPSSFSPMAPMSSKR